MADLLTYADPEALARATAAHFAEQATESIRARGRFTVALSGGTTPRRTYALLAEEYGARIPWPKVHVFWGDERCVPPDDIQSNYRLAREALLDSVPVPAENVHPMNGDLQPGRAADAYEQTLRHFFSSMPDVGATAHFDLILLGMGADGHTASLFPGTAALQEHNSWVVGHYVEKLGTWRLTLTLPIIDAAAQVTFVVSGESKAKMLKTVLAERPQRAAVPAQMVQPREGRLLWMVDAAAAALL